MREIPTGSFRPGDELPPSEIRPANEFKAEPRPDLVAKYKLFDREVHPPKSVIYHPCGANDVSPSAAFPGSRVIYVETDEYSVEALKRGGFEAHHASAIEYDPGEIDILIMLNPTIHPDVPAKHVKKSGYAVVNDYHATATTLRDNPDFQLRGIVRIMKDGSVSYDTDHPENYWKEIDTEEEFRTSPFSWGAVNYETAAVVVETLTGKRENVLTEYKKILAETRERSHQEYERILAESPEMAELMCDPEEEDILMLNHKGRQFVLPTQLPRKKGTVDDLFVFERIAKTESQEKVATPERPDTLD